MYVLVYTHVCVRLVCASVYTCVTDACICMIYTQLCVCAGHVCACVGVYMCASVYTNACLWVYPLVYTRVCLQGVCVSVGAHGGKGGKLQGAAVLRGLGVCATCRADGSRGRRVRPSPRLCVPGQEPFSGSAWVGPTCPDEPPAPPRLHSMGLTGWDARVPAQCPRQGTPPPCLCPLLLTCSPLPPKIPASAPHS